MKKLFSLLTALALCLSLAACGDTESDDTQSGYETVTDMEFLDGMYSAATNVNDARRAERLPGHQCFDY